MHVLSHCHKWAFSHSWRHRGHFVLQKTDTGHFVSEWISGKMSQQAQRTVIWCHESNWCSFVHDHDDDQNGDVTLPPGQMLNHIISTQLPGSMWSQIGGTDGKITVCWFCAVLREVNHVKNSVHILSYDCSAHVYIHVHVSHVRPRQRPTTKVTNMLASLRPWRPRGTGRRMDTIHPNLKKTETETGWCWEEEQCPQTHIWKTQQVLIILFF